MTTATPAPRVGRRRLWPRHWWQGAWRWLLWGPLIGGLPFNLLLLPVPWAYAIGAAPAWLAGLLFSLWWALPSRRLPDWRWRAMFGLLCSLLACLAWEPVLRQGLGGGPRHALPLLLVPGLPAGLLLALTQPRPTSP